MNKEAIDKIHLVIVLGGEESVIHVEEHILLLTEDYPTITKYRKHLHEVLDYMVDSIQKRELMPVCSHNKH